MGKLPKSMQQQRKKNRDLRAQGSAAIKGPSGGNKNVNRQMRRKMQQQGLDGMEEIAAHRAIFQCEDEDLVIENPQIIKVNQQGMEIYQVIGKAESKEANSFNEIGNSETGTYNEDLDDELEPELETGSVEPLNVEITEQDIQLVAMQTSVSPEVAEAALRETNGDLAKAIINLKTR